MIFTRLQNYNRPVFSPLHRAATLHDQLEALFQNAWASRKAAADADSGYLPEGSMPPLDVFEDQVGLVVKLDLPGTRKEDIALNLEDGVLTIAGERKQDSQPATASVCRCERVSGKFERRVTLPYKVNADQIKAAYVDGVLTVTLPKAEEAKPKQIPVEIN